MRQLALAPAGAAGQFGVSGGAGCFDIPAPPRPRARRAPRLPAWREAMAGATAGLTLSLLVGEMLLLLAGG